MSGFLGKFDDFLASLGSRFWVWLAVLSFIFLYGLINTNNVLGWPSPDVWLRSVDSDIYIRLTKVRELIQGGSLYNHDIIATNAPYGGVTTPWTRPLDFILIALYQFTPSDFSIDKRLLLTANWYPLLIVVLLIYMLTKAAETGFKSVQKFGIVILCLISDALLNLHTYFMAGNADHHSLQALLWCVTLWLMLGKPTTSSAIALGLTLGTWFWISPEALPFIFTTYAILGVKAILDPRQSSHPTLAGIVATLTILIALFVEYPADQVLSTRAYDSVSMIYMILFSFCAVGFLALKYLFSNYKNVKTRWVASGITATLISAIFISLFPKFLHGPMADVDPYILTHFLPRILEATPVFKLDAGYILSSQYLAIPALLLSLRFIRKAPIFFVFMAVSFVMNMFQNRWYYYLEITSIVALAKFLPTYARIIGMKCGRLSFLLHPYLLIIYLHMVVFTILACIPPAPTYVETCQIESFQVTQSGSLVKALGNAPLTIESNALGNSGISFFTPYHYIAGYYHREGQGLKIKDKILDSPSLEAVRPLLKEHNVTALLICPRAYPTWANEYFPATSLKPIPRRNWVQINNHLEFRQNSPQGAVHPVLLRIQP